MLEAYCCQIELFGERFYFFLETATGRVECCFFKLVLSLRPSAGENGYGKLTIIQQNSLFPIQNSITASTNISSIYMPPFD